jgi:hypothetical protein
VNPEADAYGRLLLAKLEGRVDAVEIVERR